MRLRVQRVQKVQRVQRVVVSPCRAMSFVDSVTRLASRPTVILSRRRRISVSDYIVSN